MRKKQYLAKRSLPLEARRKGGEGTPVSFRQGCPAKRKDHRELNTFTTFLNSIHPTIKFNCNHSFTSLPFLEVNVSLLNGKIITDLYTKPTDKHRYLLHLSCHPVHTKRAIPFSLALSRTSRICSTGKTFRLRINELITYLNKRAFDRFLKQEMQRVRNRHAYRNTRT